jgi:hypothetical protein
VLRSLSFRARVFGALPLVVALSLAIGVATNSRSANATDPLSTVRINAGGAAVTDDDGNAWSADTGFVGGKVGTTSTKVSGTNKQGVFRDERFGMTAYRIPVTNGTYEVRLLESEHYFNSAGQRIFTVTAEGRTALLNLDVFARAGGKYKAVWLPFTVTVSDGRLDLGFTASRDNAKVDGIAVLPKTAAPVPSDTTTPTPAASTAPPAPKPSPSNVAPPPPSPEPAPEPTPEPSRTAVNSTSVLWGMNDHDSYDQIEASLGRKFALAREYRRIDQSFVSSRMQSLVNSGHSVVVSVRARNASAYIPYSAVTSGQYDSVFVNGLAQLNALATPAYFIFQHEPDSSEAKASCSNGADTTCGPEFVAAWKHIYNLAQARGYTKVVFMWTVTSYGFSPQTNVRADHYWPGAAYTDWVGVDAYNGGCEGTWYGTFDEMVERSVAWTRSNAPGKPMMLPEWGATEGSTPDAKADFFNAVPEALNKPANSIIKAISYWHEQESGCDFRVNSSTAAFNAFRQIGLSPAVAARATD